MFRDIEYAIEYMAGWAATENAETARFNVSSGDLQQKTNLAGHHRFAAAQHATY